MINAKKKPWIQLSVEEIYVFLTVFWSFFFASFQSTHASFFIVEDLINKSRFFFQLNPVPSTFKSDLLAPYKLLTFWICDFRFSVNRLLAPYTLFSTFFWREITYKALIRFILGQVQGYLGLSTDRFGTAGASHHSIPTRQIWKEDWSTPYKHLIMPV